jgi:POLQ-like helicase
MDSHVGINSGQNEHFQITDSAWGNDSFSEDVINNMDKDIPISNCSPLSNMPLGEKIKRALISNVQKPVTPKPKTVQVNAGDMPQNSSSSTEKLSTFFDIGPFFGLPLKVKSLIQKFKGITDLYRKFYI